MRRLLSYTITLILFILFTGYFGIDEYIMIIGIIALSTTHILDSLD